MLMAPGWNSGYVVVVAAAEGASFGMNGSPYSVDNDGVSSLAADLRAVRE